MLAEAVSIIMCCIGELKSIASASTANSSPRCYRKIEIILRAFRLARHDGEDRPQVLRRVLSSSLVYVALSPTAQTVNHTRGLLPRSEVFDTREGYLSRTI